MAKRSDDPSPSTRAERLLGAVERVRADRGATGVEARSVRPKPQIVQSEPTKTRPRAITFPKPTSALRVHVAKVAERPVTPTPIRIRQRPVAATPVTVPRPEGPSPAMRQRAADIGRVAAIETRHAVGRGAAAAAHDLGAIGTILGSPVTFGRLVRERREHLGLTQSELAVRAGVGRRFISELEAGKPTLEMGRMLGVLHALGVRLVAEVADDG